MADSLNTPTLSKLHQALSRRALMREMAAAGMLAAVPVAAVALPAAALASNQTPTDEELTRYYTFLWQELWNLSEEMGVDMLNGYTTIRNDDNRVVRANLDKSPSIRARQALQAAGLEVERFPSVRRFPKEETSWVQS